jgi:RimJ/RimL family protein N-acetyltransferase
VDVTPVTLELDGGVVRLEPLAPSHAADLVVAGKDDSVWTYLMERPRTLDEMHGWIERALAAQRSGRELPFAIVETATGRAIGSTRYEEILPRHRSLEIGWTWIGTPWQRTACNTQCKLMLLRHAFETLGAVRVQLKGDTRNRRSLAAIERIGATFEGVLRKNRILPDGFVRDSAYYSVIREEWLSVKARLERMATGQV